MIYPLVRELAVDGIPVAVTCRVLKIARQPYYRWLVRPVTDAELVEAYRANALFDAHRDDPEFGYRFLVDEAVEAGQAMAERTGWRICSTNGWWSAFGKPRRGKHGKRPGPPVHDDLCAYVDRHGVTRHEFAADSPNELWLTDITEHWTTEGKLYLCAVKDVYSNRIVGYSIDSRMKSRLAVSALNNAVARAVTSPAAWSTATAAARADSTGRRNTPSWRCGVVRGQQAADRAIRPKLRSPGHPKFQRHVEAAFWTEIAKGFLPIEAAATVGGAQAVGQRWFRHAGGMAPFDLTFKPTGRYLSFAEREEIALLKAQNKGVREIARAIGRDPATVSRELRRNAATRAGSSGYLASVAQWKADMAAKRPKPAKLVANPRLHAYVHERLSGQIKTPDGKVVRGPEPPRFTGINKPHRKHRGWSWAWSPEQISNRLKVDFPGDDSMRISHEAIYQSLYIEGRGALNRELVWCLRTGRALRAPRERSRRKTWAHVTPRR